MERVIRAVGEKGNLWYLYQWKAAAPGCRELPSWTNKQARAKRYPRRSLALQDLARVKEWDSFIGDEEDLAAVKLVGTTAAARTLIAATRLATELRGRATGPRALKSAEAFVKKAFVMLCDALDEVEAKRRAR
jgi:hypothetical protein